MRKAKKERSTIEYFKDLDTELAAEDVTYKLSILAHRAYEATQNRPTLGGLHCSETEQEILWGVFSRLRTLMVDHQVYPTFSDDKILLDLFVNSIESNDLKILYLKSIQSAIATREMWDSEGINPWATKKLQAIRAAMRVYSQKSPNSSKLQTASPVTDADKLPTSSKSRTPKIEKSQKIRWTGTNAQLIYLFDVLRQFDLIGPDVATKRMFLIVEHFADKFGEKFKEKSIEQGLRNYKSNKKDGRPRDADILVGAIEKIAKLSVSQN